jgi:hypothetical protein
MAFEATDIKNDPSKNKQLMADTLSLTRLQILKKICKPKIE